MGHRGLVRVTALAAIIACLAPSIADAAAKQKERAQAAPQSLDARYQSCRVQAFRKFGWHNGSQTVLYTTFVIEQTDFCMRNGGRL
jgi:hypothetical protein